MCPLLRPCHRAPKVHGEAILPTTGIAEVTPPLFGEPWHKYELRLCLIARGTKTAVPSNNCTIVTCQPVAAPPAITSCPLAGLEPDAE